MLRGRRRTQEEARRRDRGGEESGAPGHSRSAVSAAGVHPRKAMVVVVPTQSNAKGPSSPEVRKATGQKRAKAHDDDDELSIDPPTPFQIGKRPPAPKP